MKIYVSADISFKESQEWPEDEARKLLSLSEDIIKSVICNNMSDIFAGDNIEITINSVDRGVITEERGALDE